MKTKVVLLCVLCFSIVGCVSPTKDNPWGISDPNQVKEWIEYGTSIGTAATAAGAATGNPYLLAWGGGLVTVGGALTLILFGNKKKEEETDGKS